MIPRFALSGSFLLVLLVLSPCALSAQSGDTTRAPMDSAGFQLAIPIGATVRYDDTTYRAHFGWVRNRTFSIRSDSSRQIGVRTVVQVRSFPGPASADGARDLLNGTIQGTTSVFSPVSLERTPWSSERRRGAEVSIEGTTNDQPVFVRFRFAVVGTTVYVLMIIAPTSAALSSKDVTALLDSFTIDERE